MSVTVRKGLVLDVKERHTGLSPNGVPWCMFLAHNEKDSKSRDAIAVFAENVEEAARYTQAKVGNIIEVNKSAKRRVDGTWETRVAVTAHIDGFNETVVRDRDTYKAFAEQINAMEDLDADDLMDITKAANSSDDELPFN